MATLLLRFSGPMQSWGSQSRFTIRDTEREPTKSGVIGLCCAALGRPRSASLEDLRQLRMGVRVDREGKISYDWQTAQNIINAEGKIKKDPEVSRRYFLMDAIFLVGLEGDFHLLEVLHNAIQNPVWFLYLGRKAFVPTETIWLQDGLRKELALREALISYPWLGDVRKNKKPETLRLILEDPAGTIVKKDDPLSFENRLFTTRFVTVELIKTPSEDLSR